MRTENIRVFVLHVKKGYEKRAEHIEKMMARLGIEFEYFLEGDIPDITPELLDKYFTGMMKTTAPTTSCALKHLLCHEKIAAEGLPYALILKDDIFLTNDFVNVFEKSVKQFLETVPAGRPAIASYEATWLKFLPRSQRRKDQVLYRGNMLQCLGAYFVNREFSESVTRITEERKCDQGIDTFIDGVRKETGFCDLFQYHPVIAEQDSHNGRMESSLGNPVTGNRLWIRIRRGLTKTYKKVIYLFPVVYITCNPR